MKKFKLCPPPPVILFVLLTSVGLIFGQNQQFMPIGNDHLNPDLDGSLMLHSVYADSVYRVDNVCRTPLNGIVGTAGTIDNSRGCSWYYVQTAQGAYFRNVGKEIKVANGSRLVYNNHTACTAPAAGYVSNTDSPDWAQNLTGVVRQESASLYALTNGVPTSRPKFPNVENMSFSGLIQNPTITNNHILKPGHFINNLTIPEGFNVYMEPGVYYFDGNIQISPNAKLLIKPDASNNYKTTIYIKGQFKLDAGTNGVKVGGTFAPEGFQNCTIPKEAEGQILVISLNKGITGYQDDEYKNVKSAIAFGSNSTTAVGTFIAPYGEFYVMSGGTVIGQVLAKNVFFCWAYGAATHSGVSRVCSTGDIFIFVPYDPATITINAQDQTFPEDKYWNWETTGWNKPQTCDEPKYFNPAGFPNNKIIDNNYKWSATKNRDYDTAIVIELSEMLPAGAKLSFTYEITETNGKVGMTPLPFSSNHPRDRQVYVKTFSETLSFEGNTTTLRIPLGIVDIGDNKGAATFKIEFKNLNKVGDIETSLPAPITITILSDDPDLTEFTPQFTQERVIEYYQGNIYKKVGTLSVGNDPCNTVSFEYLSAQDLSGKDISDWFSLAYNNCGSSCVVNEIMTTGEYRADYENVNQQKVKIKAIAINKNIKSDPVEFIIDISPWNDNPFRPQDDLESVEEGDFVMIDVLGNDKIDDDLPKAANRQKIIGLTTDNRIPLTQKNANPDRDQSITTALGAIVTIENGMVKYDISHITDRIAAFQDVFYYTALDTAEYKDHKGESYETDVWVKSVKVTIYIDADIPIARDYHYYDSKGAGTVDSVVIQFDKVFDIDQTDLVIDFAGKNFDPTDVRLWAYGKTETGDDDSMVYVILLDNAPKDVTSGDMNILVIHDGFTDDNGNSATQPISVKDRAAPVVVSAGCIKSLAGDNDTLIVTLSENVDVGVNNENIPFKFFALDGGRLYDIIFDDIKIDGTVCTFVVNNEYSGKINEGDSIFINYSADVVVKDVPFGNEQLIRDNKRVEIKQKKSTRIISAAFFDRKDVRDGYVNVIEVNLGTRVSQEFAERIIDALVPSSTRLFTKGGVIAITDDGFEFSVTEYAAQEAAKGNRDEHLPRTGIGDDEILSLEDVITDGLITVNKSAVKPADRIAPVILEAWYNVDKDTVLEVIFSEDVRLQDGFKPYGFWQKSSGKEFGMTFGSSPKKEKNNEWRYKVNSVTIAYPNDGDSIWILNGGSVFDVSDGNNEQKLTTMAPLRLKRPYDMDIQLHIVPQPLRLSKNGGKGAYESNELDGEMSEFYNIAPGSKGVAIILEMKGCVSNLNTQRGVVRIVDQTGNTVSDDIPMKFDITKNGSVAGVCVWDGKNNRGRTVGAASYLALVEAEVDFDDRPSKEKRQYRKTIAVTFKK
ncbi:MAG: hypothetical protein LBH98_06185 [Chitinispirillales bacterium]|jgi:hypothetical protein|nr:hypothetical protein [Chitinispirillales bacterium]